jgi:phage gp36-like protein
MPYILQTALKGKVPDDLLLQALDDNGDGVADEGVWDAISADVDRASDGRLEGRYTVPLAAPHPAVVAEAAIVFAAEGVYMRRGLAGDQNPWTKQADTFRKRLEAIGAGEQTLKNDLAPVKSGGAVISEPSRTYDEANRLMF